MDHAVNYQNLFTEVRADQLEVGNVYIHICPDVKFGVRLEYYLVMAVTLDDWWFRRVKCIPLHTRNWKHEADIHAKYGDYFKVLK